MASCKRAALASSIYCQEHRKDAIEFASKADKDAERAKRGNPRKVSKSLDRWNEQAWQDALDAVEEGGDLGHGDLCLCLECEALREAGLGGYGLRHGLL